MAKFEIESIGRVEAGRKEAVDDDWGGSESVIVLDPRFEEDALAGLESFSHVEVLFVFDRVDPGKIVSGARHPRNNRAWPAIGIFAQRGKNRPNRIGLCACRVISVDGLALEVEGLDAIDGTPVLDIKPLMRGFQPRETIGEPAWAQEIMKDYW